MTPLFGWCFLIVVGAANIYLGRLLALWGLPADFVGRRTPALVFLAGAVVVCAVLFLLSDQQTQYFSLNFVSGGFLSGCMIVSYLYFGRLYRPPVSWDSYFNGQIEAVVNVLKRQGFRVGAEQSNDPGDAPGGFHFDEQDFRELLAIPRMDFYAPRPAWYALIRPGEPIDFDRVCAEEVVRLAEAIPRQMEELAESEPLANVDRGALKQVTRFAEALKEQRGL